MFNNTFQIALPDPSITPGQFTVSIPNFATYEIAIINNQVFLNCHLQSYSTIPANPVSSPVLFQYRALGNGWRDDTATQFNNFVDFVNVTSATYALTTITPVP